MMVFLVLVLLGLFVFPKKTFAYVDPGTGSYVLQLVLGLLFGGVVAIKLYWKGIKSFFSNLLKKKFNDKNEE